MIEIVVLGEPVAKGRPRFNKATGMVYTPAKTASYEAALKYAAYQAMTGQDPLTGPLFVHIVVKKSIPPSWPKKRQEAARAGLERPTGKPDFDNFAKVVDAANLVAWVDDGQIVDGLVQKFYSDKPGMWIRVRPALPAEMEF